ncbi:hypothetical protein HaLaN_30622, partial [Haematococcus lacustris]
MWMSLLSGLPQQHIGVGTHSHSMGPLCRWVCSWTNCMRAGALGEVQQAPSEQSITAVSAQIEEAAGAAVPA